jgi:hypothetical protein
MQISDTVLVALIAGAPGIITAILSVRNHTKLTEVGKNVNGRLTEYIDLTRKSSYAQGIEDRRKNVADVASTQEIATQKAEEIQI